MSSLLRQNPWWENPENIETDPNIIQFEKSRFKWTPRIRHYIKLDNEAIYTLRAVSYTHLTLPTN